MAINNTHFIISVSVGQKSMHGLAGFSDQGLRVEIKMLTRAVVPSGSSTREESASRFPWVIVRSHFLEAVMVVSSKSAMEKENLCCLESLTSKKA